MNKYYCIQNVITYRVIMHAAHNCLLKVWLQLAAMQILTQQKPKKWIVVLKHKSLVLQNILNVFRFVRFLSCKPRQKDRILYIESTLSIWSVYCVSLYLMWMRHSRIMFEMIFIVTFISKMWSITLKIC